MADDRAVHLRLIETTDLHLHLLPYDYYADRPMPDIGLASAARLIAEARAEAPNALLFDNGDFLQGTPMGDFIALEGGMREGDLHPVIAAMNALSFDAITLGNHEFNYGLDFLKKTLARAAFPVVSANLLKGPGDQATLVKPYALLDRMVQDARGESHPLRLGVIGFAPPQVVDWDRHMLEGQLWARDIVAAARTWLPEMREAGADVIVALAHTGIGPARHTDGMENAALPLARLDGIDALLTGHNHLLFPSPLFAALPEVDVPAGTLAGKPAVMGGCWGAHIGLIDLLMQREGGRWRVLGSRSETRALAPAPHIVPPAPRKLRGPGPARVAAAVEDAHQATLTAIRRPVGHSARPLHSFFAHLGCSAALALVTEAQRAYVAERLSDPGLRALPILSATAPFKAGGRSGPMGYTDAPAGPLALRHIADLYAFPNAIAALRVTGAEVLEWLERSAAAYNRIQPGARDTPLRNPEIPGYNFELIDAIDVTYDLSQPARYDSRGTLISATARRVVSALFEGQPVAPGDEFILCTNSYRASGAGGFASADYENLVFRDERLIRDILRQHIARQGTIDFKASGSLRFAPVPAAYAIFETSPAARAHLDEIAAFAPEERGLSGAGFLRLKISLSGAH
ncbi:MAG: bifunctional 2',3'-cyclic-nucleotide 2'-phosphodiesterase/3'-nucleotidase [Pararhodobacter sp.]|nr:bifunctional 2',3'-cyclic-nucleotide 2'-phosphodiesterase/3'-nucleotidase [Pararhodobacter sp.]